MGKLDTYRDRSIDIFIKFILELMIHRIYLFLSRHQSEILFQSCACKNPF